jgi:hypothetical protein
VKGERHPTLPQLLESAIRTIEEVLMPELQTPWARGSAMGLAGQLRYALVREECDSLAAQDVELEGCLEGLLAEFPELRELSSAIEPSGDASWDLRERAGRLLIFALDGQAPAAAAVRARLRPLLTAQVLQDLAETGPMLKAFLESGSVGSTG